MRKSSTIDFWSGFEYGSWQYHQKYSHLKDISPVMLKLFVSFLSCIILFCRTNQKNMSQKEVKDWDFKVYLLTGEPSHSLIRSDWIIENYLCQTLQVVLEFFVKGRGFALFFTNYVPLKNVKCKVMFTEAYLEPSQTSMMELFCKNSERLVTIN